METWRFDAISITKYNPNRIDIEQDYNEWTSFSDIGKSYNNKEFFREDYIVVENNYIEFIEEVCEGKIHIQNVFDHSTIVDFKKNNDLGLGLIWNRLKSVEDISSSDLRGILKITLREYVNLELVFESDNYSCVVRFGFDYYMYLNTTKDILKIKKTAEKYNLFVED